MVSGTYCLTAARYHSGPNEERLKLLPMNSPTAADQTKSPRGTAWTLITGVAVFVAILATVYSYVIPRLGYELVSATGTFVVLLHGKLLTEVGPSAWSDTEVKLSLRGMSNFDANEVLARLTE